jgi:hypothetical protein
MIGQLVMWIGIMVYNNKFNGDDDSFSSTGEYGSSSNDNLYYRFTEEESLIPSSQLLHGGVTLSIIINMSIIIVAVKCEKDYRRTFLSTSTSQTFRREVWDWQMNLPKDMSDEKAVMNIFTFHHDIYKHFDGEVKHWLESNWERWMVERPSWLTKELIVSIPLSILSKEIKDAVRRLVDDSNSDIHSEYSKRE